MKQSNGMGHGQLFSAGLVDKAEHRQGSLVQPETSQRRPTRSLSSQNRWLSIDDPVQECFNGFNGPWDKLMTVSPSTGGFCGAHRQLET